MRTLSLQETGSAQRAIDSQGQDTRLQLIEGQGHGEPLEQEESSTTRALSQKLSLHQSSISHTLKELMEEDLVIKKGKGYLLSNIGTIQKNTVAWMGMTLRCLNDHRDFFLSHDLSGIPRAFR